MDEGKSEEIVVISSADDFDEDESTSECLLTRKRKRSGHSWVLSESDSDGDKDRCPVRLRGLTDHDHRSLSPSQDDDESLTGGPSVNCSDSDVSDLEELVEMLDADEALDNASLCSYTPPENKVDSGIDEQMVDIRLWSEINSDSITPSHFPQVLSAPADDGTHASDKDLSTTIDLAPSSPERNKNTSCKVTGGGGRSFQGRQPSEDRSPSPFVEQMGSEDGCHMSAEKDRVEGNNEPDTSFYGMGAHIRTAIFEVFNITALHPWQDEMLRKHTAEPHKNGLVIAPTSGGKTIVCVILLVRCMILESRDTILSLPYVAIVTEKVRELKHLAAKLKFFSVKEYAGHRGQFPIPKQKASLRSLYVATNEKASLLFKCLSKDGRHVKELGLIVFDEIHLISDGMRGPVIEDLIANVLFSAGGAPTRILGLSATIGNHLELCQFLGGGSRENCILHLVSRRPIKINEHLVVAGSASKIIRDDDKNGGGEIEDCTDRCDTTLLDDDDEDGLPIRDEDAPSLSHDEKVTAKLVFDCMRRHDPVLVFCSSRNKCVSACTFLTKAYKQLCSAREDSTTDEDLRGQRNSLIGHLLQESKGMVDRVLLQGLVGIGYHSAALSPTERKGVEDAFTRGIITVLCCTTTLAAGVNLPAQRVIILSPYVGQNFLTCSKYLQMVGRAGRSNLTRPKSCHDGQIGLLQQRRDDKNDDPPSADSFIFVLPHDVPRFENLVRSHVERVTSQLTLHSSHYRQTAKGSEKCKLPQDSVQFSGVTRLVLSVINMASTGVVRLSELIRFYTLTLLYQLGRKKKKKKGLSTVPSVTIIPSEFTFT